MPILSAAICTDSRLFLLSSMKITFVIGDKLWFSLSLFSSIIKYENGKIEFTITDHIADLKIEYKGVLPALFREKQGIVAEGKLITSNLFKANKLLAKHDENYTPPELVKIDLNRKKKATSSYELTLRKNRKICKNTVNPSWQMQK